MEKYLLKFLKVFWQVWVGLTAGIFANYVFYLGFSRRISNHHVLLGAMVGVLAGRTIGRWVYKQIHA